MELSFIGESGGGIYINKQIIVLVVVFAIFITMCGCVDLSPNIGLSSDVPETYLLTSQSPDGKYILEAYKTEPDATVDFSIKVYIKNEDERELIYNSYHEYRAEIFWISNCEVVINGKTLNMAEGDTYDWRE